MESSRGESPQFETPVAPGESVADGVPSAETIPVTPEAGPSKQTAAPVIAQPILPVTPDPAVTIPTDDQTVTAATKTKTSAAHDSDRIERQWVERAKTIVAQTKDDPYKQKNEMSQVKADYIQQRFNKAIKTNDNLAIWQVFW